MPPPKNLKVIQEQLELRARAGSGNILCFTVSEYESFNKKTLETEIKERIHVKELAPTTTAKGGYTPPFVLLYKTLDGKEYNLDWHTLYIGQAKQALTQETSARQ